MEKENALKILRELHDKALFSERTALETLIPELKESEDEKIRKELITHCRNTRCVTEEGAERIAKWIDWLEKQGEKKPIIEMITPEESLGIDSETYNKIVNDCIFGDDKQKLAWSEEDERMCQETIDWFEKKCFPYALESENPARESIKWLKSLKQRITP